MRAMTESLITPLSPEDMVVQSMPNASPVKWHLAHTTRLFERLLLDGNKTHYQVFDSSFEYLFNSHYDAAGPRRLRPLRSFLSQPSLEEVIAYRQHVDHHMVEWLDSGAADHLEHLVESGMAHEEEHQEPLLMDVLHLFFQSPNCPAHNTKIGNADPCRATSQLSSAAGQRLA